MDMTIKEIEAITGLPRASIRFYESEGLIHPSRGDNGYRNYSQEDLETLEKIRLLRQLDCSLEDIRSLQQGELSLEQLLEARLTDLSRRQADTEEAIRLCRQLQADGADWAGLDPQRYRLPPHVLPAREETSDIRFSCPWRRFFARETDFMLYTLLWEAFLGLVLRNNLMGRTGLEAYLYQLPALGLTLLLEPLFLHFTGTTPGKWLMGLRLTRSDGSLLSLPDAFRRTLCVLAIGDGLRFPLISVAANLLSYLRCRRGQEQPWALEDEVWSDGTDGRLPFWEQRGHALRAGGLVGVFVAVIALTMAVQLFAASPRYHGPLTPQQLADNYNHLSFFDASPDMPAYRLEADGSWSQTDPDALIFNVFGGDPTPLSIRTQGEQVTQVSFSVDSMGQEGFFSIPLQRIDYLLHALLGQRSYLSSSPVTDMLRTLSQAESGFYTWELEGWQVTCQVELQGYLVFDGQLFSREGQEREFRLDFAVQAL